MKIDIVLLKIQYDSLLKGYNLINIEESNIPRVQNHGLTGYYLVAYLDGQYSQLDTLHAGISVL